MKNARKGRVWVKICGITCAEDALTAVAAGADAIGVNFVSTSPRFCEPRAARRIVDVVASRAVVFGVFASATRAHIAQVLRESAVDGIQLHGGEPPEDLEGWSLPVLRAVPADSRERIVDAVEDALTLDYRLLLDSAAGGGSGVRFDDSLVAGLDLSEAIVAGGLTPSNVGEVVARLRPWGVDVAGGVESGPGRKEPALVREFIKNASST